MLSAVATVETQYVVTAIRHGRVVTFRREGTAAAFATARRLRNLGWMTRVEDGYAESATNIRAARVAR